MKKGAQKSDDEAAICTVNRAMGKEETKSEANQEILEKFTPAPT